MLGSKIYNVGIYIRLSREDEEKKTIESESISNQRNLILNYINNSNDNFKIYDEYVDDEYLVQHLKGLILKELLEI